MAYVEYDEGLPVGTRTGPETVSDIQLNENALRDMIVSGGSVNWPMEASGPSEEEPTQLLYSKGTEKLKLTLVWGTVAGADGNVASILYEYSSDTGGSYETMGTKTFTYDTSGNVTATGWA